MSKKTNKINFNPDVLSCLANLSNDEVFTTPDLANQMLDTLPKEIWFDPRVKFLDPCCKSGVFLREITRRLIDGLKNEIPDLQQRINHILKNQVYGIAITELTSLVSRRSVYCSKYPSGPFSVVHFNDDDSEGRIRYKIVEHDWQGNKCSFCGASKSEYDRDESLETYAYEFIHTKNPEEIWGMKFDVIIGNPPYQLSDGGHGASAIPIYQKFVQQAKKLEPKYLTMIIPARWYAGGRGLTEFREEMLNDRRLKVLTDFFNPEDCFPGIDLSGGVCYFLWDRDYDGPCEVTTNLNGKKTTRKRYLLEEGNTTFVRFNVGVDILNKVNKLNEPSFESLVSANDPFGYDVRKKNSYKRVKPDIKNNEFEDSLKIHYWGNKGKSVGYIDKSSVRKNIEEVDKLKVFISRSYGERGEFPYYVLGKPFIGEPGTVCTETYLIINANNDKKTAENIMNYISTKFFRFLVMLKKNTQSATRKVYEFVPLQDFSKKYTDRDLYKKYKLNSEEIDFIESMIKPMTLED